MKTHKLKKFRVRLTRDRTESVDIVVTANTLDEAQTLAETKPHANWFGEWALDDSWGNPFVSSIELVEKPKDRVKNTRNRLTRTK